jgi:DNA-binding transcriptional ArsR family regulator
LSSVPTDPLSTTFAALADPTRRAILARVSTGEATVGELAAPFDMSLPAISKHLKVLERAGLIVRGREAQWRPCRLKADPLKDAAGWIEDYRHHWEHRLDRLDEYLQAQHGTGAKQGRRRSKADTAARVRRKQSDTPTR